MAPETSQERKQEVTMGKKLGRAALCRLETIGIRQLSAEVSLGLRSPVTVRAGEVYGGRPGKQLSSLYAYMQTHNATVAVGKEGVCGRT